MQQDEWDFQQNVRDNIFGIVKTKQFLLKSASLEQMDEQVNLFYTCNYTFDQIFEYLEELKVAFFSESVMVFFKSANLQKKYSKSLF